jgi:quercetin dioxygenase-like cupin family protein
MQKQSLEALGREQMEAAGRSRAARSATTVVGGHEHVMRQTLVALKAGAELSEHENPGEATLLCLRGRVDLTAGADTWQARDGDLVEIPQARHGVKAIEDSIILLTAVPRGQVS